MGTVASINKDNNVLHKPAEGDNISDLVANKTSSFFKKAPKNAPISYLTNEKNLSTETTKKGSSLLHFFRKKVKKSSNESIPVVSVSKENPPTSNISDEAGHQLIKLNQSNIKTEQLKTEEEKDLDISHNLIKVTSSHCSLIVNKEISSYNDKITDFIEQENNSEFKQIESSQLIEKKIEIETVDASENLNNILNEINDDSTQQVVDLANSEQLVVQLSELTKESSCLFLESSNIDKDDIVDLEKNTFTEEQFIYNGERIIFNADLGTTKDDDNNDQRIDLQSNNSKNEALSIDRDTKDEIDDSPSSNNNATTIDQSSHYNKKEMMDGSDILNLEHSSHPMPTMSGENIANYPIFNSYKSVTIDLRHASQQWPSKGIFQGPYYTVDAMLDGGDISNVNTVKSTHVLSKMEIPDQDKLNQVELTDVKEDKDYRFENECLLDDENYTNITRKKACTCLTDFCNCAIQDQEFYHANKHFLTSEQLLLSNPKKTEYTKKLQGECGSCDVCLACHSNELKDYTVQSPLKSMFDYPDAVLHDAINAKSQQEPCKCGNCISCYEAKHGAINYNWRSNYVFGMDATILHNGVASKANALSQNTAIIKNPKAKSEFENSIINDGNDGIDLVEPVPFTDNVMRFLSPDYNSKQPYLMDNILKNDVDKKSHDEELMDSCEQPCVCHHCSQFCPCCSLDHSRYKFASNADEESINRFLQSTNYFQNCSFQSLAASTTVLPKIDENLIDSEDAALEFNFPDTHHDLDFPITYLDNIIKTDEINLPDNDLHLHPAVKTKEIGGSIYNKKPVLEAKTKLLDENLVIQHSENEFVANTTMREDNKTLNDQELTTESSFELSNESSVAQDVINEEHKPELVNGLTADEINNDFDKKFKN